MVLLSCDQARESILLPLDVPGIVRTVSFVFGFQIFTVPSSPPDAIYLPSGDHAITFTPYSSILRIVFWLPICTTCTKPTDKESTRYLLSGDHDIALTA